MPTYIDADTVKGYAKVPYSELDFADEASYDIFIDKLIERAEAHIDRLCRRTFRKVSDAVEEYDGDGSRFLFVKNPPILSVGSVKTRSSKTDSWTTVDADDYYVYEAYIYYESRWSLGRQNIQVTYSYGSESVPDEIQDVCTRAVANMLQYCVLNKMGPLIRQAEFKLMIPDQRVFTPDLIILLEKFIRPSIGIL